MDYYENGRDMEEAHADFVIPKHWEKRRWYKRYPLSEREEDNLVMDEMEREGYESS